MGTYAVPPQVYLRDKCLTILPDLPNESNLTGLLVLDGARGSDVDYLFDMATRDRFPIPITEQVKSLDFAVSPDGDWLAYSGAATTSSTEYSLVIRTADNMQSFHFPWDDREWSYLAHWVSDEWIALVKANHGERPLYTLILLNPFTGQKQAMEMDYPHSLTDDFEWYSWPTITIYDPTLSKVVYVGYSEKTGKKLVLWDRLAQRAIVEIPNFGFTIIPPLWSPNGNQFVYIKSRPSSTPVRRDEEIVLVKGNGEIIPLTRLSDYFQQTRISSYAWSPDNRSLAFWFWAESKESNETGFQLAVVDTISKEVMNYCIATDASVPRAPIWSPDSQYLAVEVVNPDEDIRTVLVNIDQELAAQVAEFVVPAGWMRAPGK
jgi:Tol biopolymer transport system component